VTVEIVIQPLHGRLVLQADRLAAHRLAEEGRSFLAVAFDRLRGVDRLGRVHADQPDGRGAAVELHDHGIAVDDPDDPAGRSRFEDGPGGPPPRRDPDEGDGQGEGEQPSDRGRWPGGGAEAGGRSPEGRAGPMGR